MSNIQTLAKIADIINAAITEMNVDVDYLNRVIEDRDIEIRSLKDGFKTMYARHARLWDALNRPAIEAAQAAHDAEYREWCEQVGDEYRVADEEADFRTWCDRMALKYNAWVFEKPIVWDDESVYEALSYEKERGAYWYLSDLADEKYKHCTYENDVIWCYIVFCMYKQDGDKQKTMEWAENTIKHFNYSHPNTWHKYRYIKKECMRYLDSHKDEH